MVKALRRGQILGHIDEIHAHHAAGWAAFRKSSGDIEVRVRHGDRILSSVRPSRPRPDVVAAIGRPGSHGFFLAQQNLRDLLASHEAVIEAGNEEAGFHPLVLSPGAEIGSPDDFQFRSPLWSPEFPLIIMWSEKSACTTVVKWFFFQLGLLDEALSHSSLVSNYPWVHDYENEVYKKKDAYLTDLAKQVVDGKKVIKFARDPLARAYSSYLETCRSHILDEDRQTVMRDARQSILKYLTGECEKNLEYTYSFFQYLDWLEEQEMTSLDGHFRQQYQEVEQNLDVEIFRIENIGDAFRRLEEDYNLKSSASERERIFTSHHHHLKGEVDVERIERYLRLGMPLIRSKNFPYFRVDTNLLAGQEVLDRVKAIYGRDFEAYGYN